MTKTITTTRIVTLTVHDVTIPWQKNRVRERERAQALISKIRAAGGSLTMEVTETCVDINSIELDL